MTTIKSRNLQRNMTIKFYVKKGYSNNQILKIIQKQGLGLRRKPFLAKMRNVRGKKREIYTYKYTPTKYKTKEEMHKRMTIQFQQPTITVTAPPKKATMFRVSLAINDVPVHKKYKSFLLQAFSNESNRLTVLLPKLKDLLLDLTNKYLGYNYNVLAEWNQFSYFIATEYPTEIVLDAKEVEQWFFMVERDGADEWSKRGNLDDV